MKKFAPLAALAAIALLPASVHADTKDGEMIYGPNGKALAAAYHVNSDGSVQIIVDGQLVTLPASTLSTSNGKTVSSKSKTDIMKSL